MLTPSQSVSAHLVDRIELPSSYISGEVLNSVEYAISDALSSDSWVDVGVCA